MRQFSLIAIVFLTFIGNSSAQQFDDYLNKLLTNIDKEPGVKKIEKLTPDEITDYDSVIPRANAAFIVVKTNEGRYCKLLVQSARQKINDEKSVPILYIVRFVTYREGTEQQRVVAGEKLLLFPGFRLNLDLGQVVPKELTADLQVSIEDDSLSVKPVDKATLYLLTKPIEKAKPKKGTKIVVGNKFDPKYFNGKFKLYDDGRRSGTLHLKVDKGQFLDGAYYSDRDGQKYEVFGKILSPQHVARFTIKLPRTEQHFFVWLFTADAKTLTGYSVMEKHESGFYAKRIEE